MKKIIFICLILFSPFSLGEYGFDRMRCKGQLIERGDSVNFVISQCGAPILKEGWGNQYETDKTYIFSSDGSRRYIIYFKNDKVESSRMFIDRR
ncbi:DUF2845 domain-containing protein [Legionella septentrionalis]|uniref:DUF2845 domain-containing protein n=1 Tax=Legionella septentrionalis TaxID=2498109 RepID=UPI000F8F222B|nr:DUF2845 domain-containing protein [Legionella septentrionalis]RUR13337.1 DUF2845 domain-containing protein [Legionella septentrionalis]